MKCEVASDLLTLYVDDLCSTETRKELELHLKDCPDCEKKLEHYRKNLKPAIDSASAKAKEKTLAETEAEIEPMKKVKKKMKKSKRKVITLSIVLLLVLGSLGFLSVGEATNLWPGFTMISDTIKIKAACDDLAKGETEAFMDLLAYHMEDQYILRATGAFEDMDAYMASIQTDVEEAYKYYFEGKDVKVKVNAVYANPYAQTMGADDIESMVYIEFYEGDSLLYQMDFGKVARGKFIISEYFEDLDVPSFTGGLIPYDDIVLKITLPYAAQSGYRNMIDAETKHMGAGLVIGIRKTGANENVEFSERKREKLDLLFEKGCYIKHVNYSICDYDHENSRWIYNIWITYEDQHSGAIFVTEQKFMYCNGSMCVMDGEEAVVTSISADTQSIPAETIELALGLFQ